MMILFFIYRTRVNMRRNGVWLVAFCVVKGGVLRPDMPPFASRRADLAVTGCCTCLFFYRFLLSQCHRAAYFVDCQYVMA